MDVTSHSITLISIIVGLGLTELLPNLHRLIHAPVLPRLVFEDGIGKRR